MPTWVTILLAVAAVVAASGVIWRQFLKPLSSAIHTGNELIPIAKELAEQLKDTPDAFAVLKDIIEEFRSDGGSSLKDIVIELKSTGERNTAAIQKLIEQGESAAQIIKTGQEASRILAAEDRVQIANLLSALGKLEDKVVDVATTVEDKIPPVEDKQ